MSMTKSQAFFLHKMLCGEKKNQHKRVLLWNLQKWKEENMVLILMRHMTNNSDKEVITSCGHLDQSGPGLRSNSSKGIGSRFFFFFLAMSTKCSDHISPSIQPTHSLDYSDMRTVICLKKWLLCILEPAYWVLSSNYTKTELQRIAWSVGLSVSHTSRSHFRCFSLKHISLAISTFWSLHLDTVWRTDSCGLSR